MKSSNFKVGDKVRLKESENPNSVDGVAEFFNHEDIYTIFRIYKGNKGEFDSIKLAECEQYTFIDYHFELAHIEQDNNFVKVLKERKRMLEI